MNNRITALFGIKYPIVQGGMIWASGWKLASAVSNAGGLGLLGAGSMYPEVLRHHIQKCRAATPLPFGVNVPMLYPNLEELMEIIIAEQAGVDAIVAEGFEAGGHNGRDETTTLTLIPAVRDRIKVPLLAAGGIASGKSMLAAMVLGADGVQVGSRFVASVEASSHPDFKQRVVAAGEGDTHLTLKELAPVRLLKNKFYKDIENAYRQGAGVSELQELLGRARAKRGMFEGDMEEGELEIGQVAALIHDILPAATIVENMMSEFEAARESVYELFP